MLTCIYPCTMCSKGSVFYFVFLCRGNCEALKHARFRYAESILSSSLHQRSKLVVVLGQILLIARCIS
ncbi:hypothetical protein HanRHA438_Chr01g0004701 [Helianthus annuus]|nr:hypothetical protein HanIR_Chr01g0004881 [Helianthus annuus]KAJ0625647.1 hypothetical protein HanHA89_Chr01g0003981 [Helianthus annuus]KAJ0782016.1 hypothetical protein HanLR1_Chr01g0003321 [Helianthus annuus]KAJ0946506.1 hypothetical protein HanRHA438_Chr01g0004701 [Helianthus annuus]